MEQLLFEWIDDYQRENMQIKFDMLSISSVISHITEKDDVTIWMHNTDTWLKNFPYMFPPL